MMPIKTQEVYLPVADNVETPYSVHALMDLPNENNFVTAVERRLDMVVMTKEELEKYVTQEKISLLKGFMKGEKYADDIAEAAIAKLNQFLK